MFNVKGDLKEIKKSLTRLEKKHMPTATAKAINNTLFQIMDAEKAQIPKKFDRPTNFTVKAFKINMAKINRMYGDIHIKPEQWKYLKYQIDGGTRRGRIGVPIKGNAVLNKFGNIPGRGKGRFIKGKKQFAAKLNGTDGVWMKTGGKKNPGLKLMVKFKDSVTYAGGLFPFHKIADGVTKNKFKRNFQKQIKRAMSK